MFIRTGRYLIRGLAALCLILPAVAQSATVYTGTWTNTTFDSTGPALFVVDIAGSDISVTADLGGFVFGLGDPPPVVLTGTISGGVGSLAVTDHPVFGDVSGSVDLLTGTVAGSATGIPFPAIHSASVSGTASATSIALDYTVCFVAACTVEGLEMALGVITAASVVPLPAAAWLLGGGLAGLGALRRRRC